MLSASQISMVRDTISTAQARILHVDSEIARLMDTVEDLQRRRSALLTYTQNHTALIAPIRRLPPEILSDIFVQCRDVRWLDPVEYLLLPPRLDKTPLLLGTICSRWRSISLSTPRLWASFSLNIRPKYLKAHVELAKIWFARSGTCPLSISLGCDVSVQHNMQRLMQVFLLHCERWYEVSLSLPLPVIRALSPARHRLLKLQKLRIDLSAPHVIDIFEHAPQLRSFYLPSAFPLPMIKVPWEQLQYCHIGGFVGECLELLRLTPNLEECSVMPSWRFPQLDTHNPVQVSRLRTITIYGDPTHILDKLVAPELHKIFITLPDIPWVATAQLMSLLLRCSLRTLFFFSAGDKFHPSGNDLIQFLRASPTLLELHILGCASLAMNEWFLALFAYSKHSDTLHLVPMLHTMKVQYTPKWFGILEFTNAVRSRMVSDTLKRVEILCVRADGVSESFDSTTLSRLRQLQGDGLNVHVIDGEKEIILTPCIS
jgi:hypothetical protein